MAGGWDEKFTMKKNPFIDGLQNYRDFLHHRFRVTTRNAAGIVVAGVIIPAIIVWGGLATDAAKAAKFKAEFPERAQSLMAKRRDAANSHKD